MKASRELCWPGKITSHSSSLVLVGRGVWLAHQRKVDAVDTSFLISITERIAGVSAINKERTNSPAHVNVNVNARGYMPGSTCGEWVGHV